MAPLSPRQIHSLTPSTPRAPKGPSSRPVPVTTSIDSKVFGELFAGTVAIFFIAVLLWKVGKFIRSFNKHKVLREGKSPKARYAKTWYGWVSLETHERNKKIFRDLFAKVQDWTAWKSTRTDYRWVWWDPGQKALEERRQNGRLLRWLPECFKSYDFRTADEIWNPGPPVQCYRALSNSAGFEPVRFTGTLRSRRRINSKRPPRGGLGTHEKHLGSSSTPNEGPSLYALPEGHLTVGRCEGGLWSNPRLLRYLSETPSQARSLPILRVNPALAQGRPLGPSPKNFGLQNHSQSWTESNSCRIAESRPLQETQKATRDSTACFGSVAPRRRHSQRYRVWSAQMQVRARRPALLDLRDSSGPPGTPMTSILASHLSGQSLLENISRRESQDDGRRLEDPIERHSVVFHHPQAAAAKRAQILNVARPDQEKAKYNTVPLRSRARTARLLEEVPRQSNGSSPSLRALKITCSRSRPVNAFWPSPESIRPASRVSHNPSDQRLENTKSTFNGPNDWEVRFMDGLDRKLVWMSNELTPGQKPYHFAMLANHWLNRETWLVIDPVSRVSNDCRRHWGDPRFNVPYPEPCLTARPKYPVTVRKRAHTPRIDSWRAAVNRQRKASGVREVIRAVELFEDSVEEPPDGKIDTAAWLLPRPPQGFEMSTSQKNAWYEGGAGWQEKLGDWQQIRRGYRLHKALHEGRVNRNHVKGVVTQVGKCCRSASVKVIPRKIEQTQYHTPSAS